MIKQRYLDQWSNGTSKALSQDALIFTHDQNAAYKLCADLKVLAQDEFPRFIQINGDSNENMKL